MFSRRRSKPVAVYVINAIGAPDLKVGRSDDPYRRLREHQTGNSLVLEMYRIEWFDSDADARWVENYAHDLLEPWPSPARELVNGKNEWFRREPPQIDWAINEAMEAFGDAPLFTRRITLPIRWRIRNGYRAARAGVHAGLRRIERAFALVGVVSALWLLWGLAPGDAAAPPSELAPAPIAGATAETGG